MIIQQKFNRLQLLVYCLCIVVSLALGDAIRLALSLNVHPFKGEWLAGTVISPLVTGGLVGVAQWFFLVRKVANPVWWILASSLGWFAGSAPLLIVGNTVFSAVNLALFGSVNLALVWMISSGVGGIIGGALGGSFLGFVQWFFLRRVPLANQWILASTIGWSVSAAISGVIRSAMVGTLGLTLAWICYGAIYGTVTALPQKLIKR